MKVKFGTRSVSTDSFGYRYISKFGWKPGDGLGKNRHGRKDHIRVSKKEEGEGVGKKKFEFGNTWANVYNNVLDKISVGSGPCVATSDSESDSSEEDVVDTADNALLWGTFVRAAVGIKASHVRKITVQYPNDSNEPVAVQATKPSISSFHGPGLVMTEDIFQACGGAQLGQHQHKFKASGKLQRLQQFESKQNSDASERASLKKEKSLDSSKKNSKRECEDAGKKKSKKSKKRSKSNDSPSRSKKRSKSDDSPSKSKKKKRKTSKDKPSS